ncbi:MAG: hypothetical protein OQK50_00040 [Deltaproteobacteria bacterium]|jgi:hypothetical protein|nr:hypothetical protein [Deltaproteobacteria bacterium]MCW8893255.1 hypothetical protein [Deltaproteobacteria bacterium]MCW9048702.1 hypothetical protein [Deltaproteobacteria bacterium]
MTMELIQAVLGWSIVINMGILLWWFLFICFAQDWVYALHSKFYGISRVSFNHIHYAGILAYKLVVFTFFIVPYLALRIVN